MIDAKARVERLMSLLREIEQLQRELSELSDYMRRGLAEHADPLPSPQANDWQYLAFPGQELIYVRLRGQVSMETFMEVRGAASMDTRFDPAFRSILDLRGCVLGDISSFDVRLLGEGSLFRPRALRVVVADTPELYGLARLYQIRRGPVDGIEAFRVVTTLDDAMALCDVPLLAEALATAGGHGAAR
jgi:hypothetical protein